MSTVPGFVVPGQIISPIIDKQDGQFRKYAPGLGAKLTQANGVEVITSTLVGQVKVTPQEKKLNNFTVSVETPRNSYSSSNNKDTSTSRNSTSVLPTVGDIVLCRITRLTARQAHAEILVIENQGAINADSGIGINGNAVGIANNTSQAAGMSASGATASSADVGEGFGGIIRLQDVRATERDKVKITTSFKPGDIVRASVISLGDGTNYYLSTGQNELGVIFAKSEAGEHMYPIDWQTMKCALTGQTEERKCAKPF